MKLYSAHEDGQTSSEPHAEGKGLNLFLFGQARLANDQGAIIPIPRKAMVLAALLLIDGRRDGISRSEAALLLWEKLAGARRAGNLRQLLSRVRQTQEEFSAPLFVFDRDSLRLGIDQAAVDVQQFFEIANAGPPSASGIDLLCNLYSGQLLDGYSEGGDRLRQWLSNKRAQLHNRFTALLAAYVENGSERLGPDHALALCERLIRADPRHEAGYRAMMRIHAGQRRNDRVRHTYARLERALRKEIGARPTPETRELYEALLRDEAAPVQRSEAPAVDSGPAIQDTRSLPRLLVMVSQFGQSSGLQPETAAIVDELTLNLWRTRSFVVLPPKMLPVDFRAREIAVAALQFDYMVELRLQVAPTNSVSVRLVSAAADEVLWANIYDVPPGQQFPVAAIVQSVLEQTRTHEVKLAGLAAARIAARRQVIQAQRLLQQLDLPSIRRARKIMRAALSEESDHVPALAGLARSFILEGLLRASVDMAALDEADTLARRIISLDPEDFRGYQELGIAHLYRRRFDSSLAMLQAANARNPVDVSVQLDLADGLMSAGRSDEAQVLIANARELLPGGSDIAQLIAACAHYSREEFAESAREIESMQQPVVGYRISAAAYAMLGEKEIAVRHRTAALEYNPNFKVSDWIASCPILKREHAQSYEDGLLIAGFK